MLSAYWPFSSPALTFAVIGIAGVLADTLLCATEVAVMVTVPPVGIAVGAVKVVAIPLSVLTGLNEPQGFVPVPPVQVTLQFTPPGGVESFVTVAVNWVFVPASIEAGIAVMIATVSVGGWIVTLWETVGFGAACAVATMFTGVSGRTVGAVYVVFNPFWVGLVLNVPQVPPVPGVQFAAQLTPLGAVTGSFATVALIFTGAPNAKVDGGVSAADVQLIETEFAAVIVTMAVAVTTGVATVVAVMVTTPPALVGIAVGAWNVVAMPLSVAVGLNEPQLLPVAAVQLADQVTPRFPVSFCSVATIFAVVLTGIDEGGWVVMATESAGLIMVELAFATALGTSWDAAVITTGSPPAGTMAGAV
jgi:hypothetical protein